MLPSRGIVRSLPSGAFHRQQATRSISRTLGNGRQFGTALSSPRTALAAGTRSNGRNFAVPTLLAGVSASRNLSLWGYGKKKPVEEAATTTTTATPAPEPVTPTAPIEAVDTVPSVEPPTPPVAELVPDAAAIPDVSVAATDIDFAAIADLANHDILNMAEDIGYLSKLGLDYGWGPTSIMQWTVEHIHVWGGLGWGASIIAAAALLRIVMFYPQIRSLHFNANMTRMKADPRHDEQLALMRQAGKTSDREAMQKAQFLGSMLREEYNASAWGMMWSFVQIPFSFGLFRIIGGMVNIPVPSMESAGYLWFADLTVRDPFFILPALGTGLLFGAMSLNSKYAPAAQKATMKKMMFIFGGLGFFATTFLSAGVNLMMVTTGFGTLVTAAILNNESVRRLIGLPILKVEQPKYEPPRPTSSGVAGIRERLTHNLDDMKKSMTDQITSYTGKTAGTAEERKEEERQSKLKKIEKMRNDLEREEFQKKYKSR